MMQEQSSEDEFELTPTAKDILLFSLNMDDEIAPEDLENLGELKWPHESTQVNTAAYSLELDSTIYTPRSRSQLEALSEGSCTGSPAKSAVPTHRPAYDNSSCICCRCCHLRVCCAISRLSSRS